MAGKFASEMMKIDRQRQRQRQSRRRKAERRHSLKWIAAGNCNKSWNPVIYLERVTWKSGCVPSGNVFVAHFSLSPALSLSISRCCPCMLRLRILFSLQFLCFCSLAVCPFPFLHFFLPFLLLAELFFSRRWAWKRWKFNNVSVEFRCLCLRLFLWSNDARSNNAILMIPSVGVAEISTIHFHTHSRMNATGIVEINILCRFYLCSVIFFPSRVHWSRKKFFHSRWEVKEFNNELGRMENENHFIRMSKNIFVFFFFSSFIS